MFINESVGGFQKRTGPILIEWENIKTNIEKKKKNSRKEERREKKKMVLAEVKQTRWK